MPKVIEPRMPFKRLQRLGKEVFKVILGDLMRGMTSITLARKMQSEWGVCQDVPERTLADQLDRLRKVAATGVFGEDTAKAIQIGLTPQIDALKGVSVPALERMEKLSTRLEQRVMDLMDHEKVGKFHFTGLVLSAHNNAITEYSVLLQDIQKMRFALGLDEFRGPVNTVRGAMSSTTNADGSHVQKQVFEAVTALENIFNERKVSKPLFPVR